MYLVKPTVTGALPRHACRPSHRTQLTLAALALLALGIVAVLSTSVLSVALLLKALWNLAGMAIVFAGWWVLARLFVQNYRDASVRRFVQQLSYVSARCMAAVLALVAFVALAHVATNTSNALQRDLVLFSQSLAIATLTGVTVAWLIVLVSWLRG